MKSKKDKVRCNKCGTINIIDDLNSNCTCSNCGSNIDTKTALKINLKEKSNDRLIYELENKIIVDEKYGDILQIINEKGIKNELVEYLNHKNDEHYDFSFINDTNKEILLKDLINDNNLSIDRKMEIVSLTNIKNKYIINQILDETIYKKDNSKNIIDKINSEKIQIVFNKSNQVNHNLTPFKITFGIIMILFVFLFSLFFEKELAKSISIILSIIPSLIIGISVVEKIKIKFFYKLIIVIIITIGLFYLISYLLVIRFDGIIGLKTHLKNIINAIPNFIDEIFKRLNLSDVFEEIEGE